ncbi:MAG: TonB-dependent receptor, partial [Blastocatellia bacterium]|nr:TonB-dependent receptor [Blastocatellia bacterium]
IAQLLLTPIPATVPNGFDNVGGADGINASNFASTDDVRNYYGIYFQDDWRATKKLTLNLGLRWDYFEPYREVYGAQANFIPGSPGKGAAFLLPSSRCNNASTPLSPSFLTLLQKDGIALQCSSDSTLGKAQTKNFAPRIGIAYQLKPKLVLRAGYGIFYGALDNTGYGFNLGNNYPFLYNFYFPPADAAHPIVFSNGSIGTLENGFLGVPLTPAAVNAQGLSFSLREFNFATPYTQDVNFAIQYAITPNQTLQIAYVGAFSRHGDTTVSINSPNQILPPGTNPQPYVPYPDFGQGWAQFATEGNSNYNSLQVTLERRFSGGLDFLANYTYSKARSDYIGFDRATGYRAATLPGFGIQGDYALYGNDAPHMIHFSGGYQLPFGAGRRWMRHGRGVLNQMLGGWQMNWILTLQSGQPFTIGCPIGTSSNFGCNALLVPGQDIYAGPHNVNQWLNPKAFAQPPVATTIGQSDLSPLGGAPTQARGPGLHQLDGSLIKEIHIHEEKHLEFRAEFFNLTNTPNFGFPGFLDFTNPVNFSRITSTVNSARQIQFALKFHW